LKLGPFVLIFIRIKKPLHLLPFVLICIRIKPLKVLPDAQNRGNQGRCLYSEILKIRTPKRGKHGLSSKAKEARDAQVKIRQGQEENVLKLKVRIKKKVSKQKIN
jgi:hypothetical protein